MVSSTRRAISCIVLLLSVIVLAHAQTVSSKDPTSTVTGKVIVKGKGVPGIVVLMRLNDQTYRPQRLTTYRGVSDEDGKYRITNVPAGTYYISPSAPAYVGDDFSNKTLMIDKGETVENVDFNLVRGGVITGKIVDADGRPAIEENVYAVPAPVKGGGIRNYYQPLNVLTDDRGVYRFYGLPPGAYKVAAGQDEENSYPMGSGRDRAKFKRTYHPGTLDAREGTIFEVTEGSETANIDITLSRALTMFSVSGRIVDDAGEPVPGVGYGITRFTNPNSISSWSNGAVSNVRGEFKVEGLVPGQYAVNARPAPNSDWRTDSVRFEIVDQDVTGLVMRAKKGASISGVVVFEGADDKTVREQFNNTGLNATVEGPLNERPWSNWTTVAADGSFRLGGLQGGLVSFFFSSSSRFRVARIEHNGIVMPRGIEVRDGQQLTGVRVIVAYGNASIRGVITLQNGPMPENGRFYVQVRKPGDDPRYSSGEVNPQVDSRGLFLIEGLMPGSYVISAGLYVPGATPLMVDTKQDVVVANGTTTNVSFTLDLKAAKTLRP